MPRPPSVLIARVVRDVARIACVLTQHRGEQARLRIRAGWPIGRPNGFTLVELLLSLTIVGILATIAVAAYNTHKEHSEIIQARSDIQNIESLIESFFTENTRYPDTLSDIPGAAAMRDPWGNPYQYLNITTVKGNGKVRKDHNLVPLNSDYDLYSLGEDGKSQSPLTAAASRDDILRANNGAFIGLASEY